MQFQVPQNIDMEDKIVGPLTMKNFLILLFGGMFVYVIFLLPLPRAVSIVIAVPIIIALLLVSFIKIQDQSFPKFFTSLVYFWLRPKKRVWSQKDILPEIKIKDKPKKEEIHISKQVSSQAIQKLAEIVDTKGWKPISSENSEQEPLNISNRVKSSEETNVPQAKIENKNIEDVFDDKNLKEGSEQAR
ncbi:MAG: PrgI family protein [bacterium]